MAYTGLFLGTYDPGQLVLTIDELPVIGFQEGDSIVVERSEDFSSETVGIKGEVSRAITRNETGTLTVTLQHNSPSVAQFEAMMRADYPPVVKIALYDPSSAESFSATYGWLKTDASHSFGNEVGSREYVFFLNKIRQGTYKDNFVSDLAFALANQTI